MRRSQTNGLLEFRMPLLLPSTLMSTLTSTLISTLRSQSHILDDYHRSGSFSISEFSFLMIELSMTGTTTHIAAVLFNGMFIRCGARVALAWESDDLERTSATDAVRTYRQVLGITNDGFHNIVFRVRLWVFGRVIMADF